jgi:hypothetical protein
LAEAAVASPSTSTARNRRMGSTSLRFRQPR